MLRVVRVALVWLLALALPIQSALAGTLACAPLHGAERHGTGMAASPGLEHVHAASHAAGVDHRGHGRAASHSADSGATDLSVDSCSLCASCCTAAALPAADAALLPPPTAHLAREGAAARKAGVVPDGPERPPRSAFA